MTFKAKAIFFDTTTFGLLLLGAAFRIYSPEREQLMNFEVQAAAFAIGMTGGLIVALVLTKLGVHTLGDATFPDPKKADQHKPLLTSFWGWHLLLVLIASLYAGLQVTRFSFEELFSEAGFAGARRIFSSLIRPSAEILPAAILGIVETVFIAFVATAFAIPVAFVLAFFAAKNLMGKHPAGVVIYGVLRTTFNVSRSIEPLIWAIVFSVWVGIGPFAGMLALMLHSIASLTKQYSEMIETVEQGPIEGIQSTGAGPIQVVWYGVVPQIILPYVSFTIYRWDINVRMATVIGLVGGGGIGTMLIQYQGQALWNEVGTIVLVIAAVVWIMDTASAHIREALK